MALSSRRPRTLAFHAGDTGSNPVGVTITIFVKKKVLRIPIARLTKTSALMKTSAAVKLALSKGTSLKEIVANLSELEKVEARIRSVLESDVPLLQEIPTYMLELGGKRVRPVLALLTSRALIGKVPPQVITIAAGVELIHLATLLHDDIIDHADTRRHRPSASKQYGDAAALLAGDFLFVRAFGLCAELPREIITWTEAACIALTEGELLEAAPLATHTLESATEIARRKTAALFALSTKAAVFLSDSFAQTELPTAIAQAELFGSTLGIAFQFVDDVLDVTANADLLGKPTGSDLREGKPSLVNILWLRSKSKVAMHYLDCARAVEPFNDDLIAAALDEIREGPIVAEARAIAIDYADQSRKALLKLLTARSKAMESLEYLIDFVVARLS
jgi:octaprenyl-diphosphate synthase